MLNFLVCVSISSCFRTFFYLLLWILCHAVLLQMFLSAKQREEEQRALLEKQRYLQEVLRRNQEARDQPDTITDQELVDSIFDFLPPDEVTAQDLQV